MDLHAVLGEEFWEVRSGVSCVAGDPDIRRFDEEIFEVVASKQVICIQFFVEKRYQGVSINYSNQ